MTKWKRGKGVPEPLRGVVRPTPVNGVEGLLRPNLPYYVGCIFNHRLIVFGTGSVAKGQSVG